MIQRSESAWFEAALPVAMEPIERWPKCGHHHMTKVAAELCCEPGWVVIRATKIFKGSV